VCWQLEFFHGPVVLVEQFVGFLPQQLFAQQLFA
jgi:hypothetical protein